MKEDNLFICCYIIGFIYSYFFTDLGFFLSIFSVFYIGIPLAFIILIILAIFKSDFIKESKFNANRSDSELKNPTSKAEYNNNEAKKYNESPSGSIINDKTIINRTPNNFTKKIDEKLYKKGKDFNINNELEIQIAINDTINSNQDPNTEIKKVEGFIKYMPPEKRYITPRKIDNWEEINKKRKETGDKGEQIAMAIEKEFLESVSRKDLADKVIHVSTEIGDGLGYDILSFSENGEEKYIEVKSTTVSINSPFNISSNELRFLQDNLSNAFIYRILITNDIPEFVALPSYEVLGGQITPVSFVVKINK